MENLIKAISSREGSSESNVASPFAKMAKELLLYPYTSVIIKAEATDLAAG